MLNTQTRRMYQEQSRSNVILKQQVRYVQFVHGSENKQQNSKSLFRRCILYKQALSLQNCIWKKYRPSLGCSCSQTQKWLKKKQYTATVKGTSPHKTWIVQQLRAQYKNFQNFLFKCPMDFTSGFENDFFSQCIE